MLLSVEVILGEMLSDGEMRSSVGIHNYLHTLGRYLCLR